MISHIISSAPSGRFVVPVTIGRAPPEMDVSIATTKGCETVTGVIDVDATGADIAGCDVFGFEFAGAPPARHGVEHI